MHPTRGCEAGGGKRCEDEVHTVVCASLHQSLVPTDVLGRVHSAYRLVETGCLFLGATLGGLLGRYLGLTASFWLGFCCAALFPAGAWRIDNNRDIRAARTTVTEANSMVTADKRGTGGQLLASARRRQHS